VLISEILTSAISNTLRQITDISEQFTIISSIVERILIELFVKIEKILY